MSKYKYKFYVSTGFVGSNIEHDIDLVDDFSIIEIELDAMTEVELEKEVDEFYDEWVGNVIESGWCRVEDK